MRGFFSIFKRELKGYLFSSVAYVVLVVFLLSVFSMTFFHKRFFSSNQADLRLMFETLPLIFLAIVPAIAMRLWAEERQSQSIQLLFSLPITSVQAVLGKYMAALLMVIAALGLTFPMVVTVYKLGEPDAGPIITGYIGAALLGATYLAIGSFFSCISRSQVIAFILAVVGCSVFYFVGHAAFLNVVSTKLSPNLANVLELLSAQASYESLERGVLELRDLSFFVLLIIGWLWANVIALNERKAV